MTSAGTAFAAAVPRARPASPSSISTKTSSIPAARLATASPAAPTPAPKSTTRSPERAGVAAANSTASWPARRPDFGCRRRNRPPRNASSVNSRGSVIGPQFVGQAGVAEKLARFAVIVVMDQNPARQHPERAFDNAHVLIQHQMMNIGAIEQRADRRNQHHIVGPNQFPQLLFSFVDPTRRPRDVSAHRALAALTVAFYCYSVRIVRIGQMWRPAWRLFYPSMHTPHV